MATTAFHHEKISGQPRPDPGTHLENRRHRGGRCLYGYAGFHRSQPGAGIHSRRPGQPTCYRSMGRHRLSDRPGGVPTGSGLAGQPLRLRAGVGVVAGRVRGRLGAVRPGTGTGHPDSRPLFAGPRRGHHGAGRASGDRRHRRTQPAGPVNGHSGAGDRPRAGARPWPGWRAPRSSLLALAVLAECTRGPARPAGRAHPDSPPGNGTHTEPWTGPASPCLCWVCPPRFTVPR